MKNAQTFAYNTAYSPAAPFAEVTIHHEVENDAPIIIAAQIDTGADATMLPVSALKRVGARFEGTRVAYDFSGQRHYADMDAVAITFVGHDFFLSVIAQESTSEGVIGRDILNDFIITLNGLAHVTEIIVD